MKNFLKKLRAIRLSRLGPVEIWKIILTIFVIVLFLGGIYLFWLQGEIDEAGEFGTAKAAQEKLNDEQLKLLTEDLQRREAEYNKILVEPLKVVDPGL